MTEPTKAEIMLDSVTKSNRLINYLRFCKEHPIPPAPLGLAAFYQGFHKSLSRRGSELY